MVSIRRQWSSSLRHLPTSSITELMRKDKKPRNYQQVPSDLIRVKDTSGSPSKCAATGACLDIEPAVGAWGLAALRCDARGFRSYQVPARIKIVLVIALVETAKCALLSRGSNKGSDCRPTPRGLVDPNSLFFDLASGSIGL